MPQGKSHIYFLLDDQNRSLYLEGGLVQKSANPKPLAYSPDGWSDIDIQNQRNSKYFALDRNFTVPLDFVEDGAFILKDAYYKKGVEAKVWLVILKQKLFYDGASYGYYYDSFYKGEIDFLNFEQDGPKVTVNIMEGGLAKMIKSNENVKYPIKMKVPEGEKAKMDGISLQFNTRYVSLDGEVLFNQASGSAFQKKNYLVSFLNIPGEISPFNIQVNSITGIPRHIDYPSFAGDEGFFLKALIDIQLTIHFKYKFQLHAEDDTRTNRLDLYMVNQKGERVKEFLALDLPDGEQTTDYDVDETFPLNLKRNDRLFLIMELGCRKALLSSTFARLTATVTEQTTNILYTDRFPTSYIDIFNPLYVYKELVKNVTGGLYTADSLLLQEWSNVKITCGDAIRGIAEAIMKLSFSDFVVSMNTLFDIGVGEVNGVLRLEKKAFFIDYANPINLGEVKGLKNKPAAEYIFNTIKIGFPEQEYNDVNGRGEFNNTSVFTTPHTRIAKELNLVSSIRADPYGIEFTRINYEGKITTDSGSDNDVFFLHTKKNPFGFFGADNNKPTYELDRSLNQYATGVVEPASIFNIFFSPKRCLERNGGYIHSTFYKQDAGKLVFQTTDKNAEFRTNAPGPIVIEKADKLIGTLLPALFLPHQFDFETPAPVNLIELLEASPVRAFMFTYLGDIYMGLPVKVGIRPADFKAQTYTLLSAPTNDLLTFIKKFE